MTKARKKRQATKRSKQRRASAATWMWLGGGIALGLGLSMGGVYLYNNHSGEQTATAGVPQQATSPAAAGAHQPPAASDPPPAEEEPKFDFYTMLPELEVIVPDVEQEPDTPAAPNVRSPTAPGTYALQVGSFKQLADADRLKAELALLGIEADIYTVTINNVTWHRLRVGPYSNLDRLQRITSRLRQNQVNYMVLKVKG